VNTVIYCARLVGCGCIVYLMKLIWYVFCEAQTAAGGSWQVTVLQVRKTEHMHCDSSPTGVSVGVVHLCKVPCAAAIAATPQFLAFHHGPWMYCLWGLSWVVQRCKNYMAISMGCMQSVWAPAIALHSFGPQHWTTCGRHCQQRQNHFSGRCLWLTTLHLGCSGVSAALCTSLISCRH
jgi:hypothetical protein